MTFLSAQTQRLKRYLINMKLHINKHGIGQLDFLLFGFPIYINCSWLSSYIECFYSSGQWKSQIFHNGKIVNVFFSLRPDLQ